MNAKAAAVVGRTRESYQADLFGAIEGGDFPTIIDSIDNRLMVFPADTIILPGHGVDSTIGNERPHLQEWVDRGW